MVRPSTKPVRCSRLRGKPGHDNVPEIKSLMARQHIQTKATLANIQASGCQITDVACICKDQSFIYSLLPVVQKACPPDDVQSKCEYMETDALADWSTETLDFTRKLCKTAGITLTVSIPPTAGAASSAPAPASTVNSAPTKSSDGGSTMAGTSTASMTTNAASNGAHRDGVDHALLGAVGAVCSLVALFLGSSFHARMPM